jgi:hypothetical protein
MARASFLQPYGIRSRTIWIGEESAKGYLDFQETAVRNSLPLLKEVIQGAEAAVAETDKAEETKVNERQD